jgi:hypothetical protein
MTDDAIELPTVLSVSQAFSSRLPSQRVLDLIDQCEPSGAGFGELAQTQPFRIVAFRALLRDYPSYDPAALWLHAYDCEVDVAAENPTNGNTPTPAPVSAGSGE